ncbi:citrate synthase [Cryphonectria parasitica EP155]|uniref:Citrate synthase n=1 Tax=Cryphonectria parasitica (strain ATCC 38755 / EP155) TaxID=660469 RepID=A0A9P4XXP8_CRYP1|nr:citrate synthase [Cryphonectria parasitica EP155]KAF3762833.1 citrate synthase [Cryphonectria parasitica EP155]
MGSSGGSVQQEAHFEVASGPSDTLTITDNRTGQTYCLPIEHNAIRATDFKAIKCPVKDRNPANQYENGIRLFDPGFQNTACMQSQITYVDGEAGEIYYRGIPVPELYRSGRPFEHVAFLLIFGHLPTNEEAAALNTSIAGTPPLPQNILSMIKQLPLDAHPATCIASIVAAYAASRPEKIPAHCGKNIYKGNLAVCDAEIPQFLGTYAMIATAIFCHLRQEEWQPPKLEYSYTENVLHMLRFIDTETGRPNPRVVSILSRQWILCANLELTNSTAAFLHAASTLCDPWSCSASSNLSGTGILHGGAMEVAYKQLETIGDVSGVPRLIEQVKQGKQRLFGYGHRMYKVTDPRAAFVRELIAEATSDPEKLKADKILQVALEIEKIAAEDEYFISRNLCANVDLFLTFVYKAIGIPANYVLPMCLLGRTPGMVAHWRESMSDPKPRMWRPLQLYVGKLPNRTEENSQGPKDVLDDKS